MKKPKDTVIDITNTSRRYWDKILSSLGLSNNRGLPPQFWINRGTDKEKKLRQALSVGNSVNIANIEEEQYRKRSGRVRPEGYGPDK
jgi:hypothetical protein